jgi:Protein of unknown function (DUF1173)
MPLIGEVKEIVPARHGCKAVVKHVPDQAFALDEQLYRRLGRRRECEPALWGAAEDIQMVMMATFSVAATGIPTMPELAEMLQTHCFSSLVFLWAGAGGGNNCRSSRFNSRCNCFSVGRCSW